MTLKHMVKSAVGLTARSAFAWPLYELCGRLSDSFGRIYGHARFTREIDERDESLRRLAEELFPKLIVANGPFQGMQYPRGASYGSALLPKLLGSYESELHPALEEMFANEYSVIVDIGCAEGYYAVGLALKYAQAQVYAFDISEQARILCGNLAKLNGIESRVRIGSFCDASTLRSIPLGNKALVISDCEGYEGVLFTDTIAELLAKHDLIVETHDFIDIDISSRLRGIFAKTHQVESVKSTDDIEKAHTYRYAALDGHDTKTRRLVLAERRPAIMEWLVMRSR